MIQVEQVAQRNPNRHRSEIWASFRRVLGRVLISKI